MTRLEAIVQNTQGELFSLSKNPTLERISAPNQQYKEVPYYCAEPLIFGKVFQLDWAAKQIPFKSNPLAAAAVTIVEAQLVLDEKMAGDSFRRLAADHAPEHVLNLRNWFLWGDIIGNGDVHPFAFDISEDILQEARNKIQSVTLPVYQVRGVSFKTAVHASFHMTPELIEACGLQLSQEDYMALMQPFGVANMDEFSDEEMV